MTVTFCGHSQIAHEDEVKEWLFRVVEALIEHGADTFYLGGYGAFDSLASSVVRSLKAQHPQIQSVLVLPYLDHWADTSLYDDTTYPPLEHVPRKFAITHRNRWMVDHSDVIVAYVRHSWGGAAQTLDRACRKGLAVIKWEDTEKPQAHHCLKEG